MIDRTKKEEDERNRPKTPPPPPPPCFIQDQLGPDCAVACLQFLSMDDWLILSQTCKKMLQFVCFQRVDLWKCYYVRHSLETWHDVESMEEEERARVAKIKAEEEKELDAELDEVFGVFEEGGEEEGGGGEKVEEAPGFEESSSKLSRHIKHKIYCKKIRTKAIKHAKAVYQCCKAFGKLRKDRSRERQRDIAPHVFDRRKAKNVAYPLPLRMSNIEKGEKYVGLLMSQVNTSSAEQRKIILKAMVKMR